MGEAEIQSAVEAAAVIFKKVVLQRRQAAKKANEEGKQSTILLVFSILSIYQQNVLQQLCEKQKMKAKYKKKGTENKWERHLISSSEKKYSNQTEVMRIIE